MKILIVAVSALVVGIALGIVFSAATIRHLRQRNRELRAIIREEAGPVKPETMKVYAVKSAVENLSKNNRWPDKGQQPEDEPPEDGDQAAG